MCFFKQKQVEAATFVAIIVDIVKLEVNWVAAKIKAVLKKKI